MVRELKQIIGDKDYLCYDDNGEILFYFVFPIQDICENMKKKHPEETGWLFECIADFFQEAFDLGKNQIVLDIPWFAKRTKVSIDIMPDLIENLQVLKLIECEVKPHIKYPDPVIIATPTDLFFALTGMSSPLNHSLFDGDDLHEEKPASDQRVLH